MKMRNKLFSKAGYYYYNLLASVTNGNKRFVDKKLIFGAFLIGLSSQYGCKLSDSDKNAVLEINKNTPDTKVTEQKDTMSHLYSNNAFDTLIQKNLKGIEIIDNISCYLIEHMPKYKLAFQIKTSKNEEIINDSSTVVMCYKTIEPLPEFPGGEEKLYQFLQDNLKYPQKAIDSNIQGRVYTTFTVGIDGKIRDVRILRGLSKECDEEAIRLIKLMPDWKPGNQNGKTVPQHFNLPINFTLNKKN